MANPFDQIKTEFNEVNVKLDHIVSLLEQLPITESPKEVGGIELAKEVTGLTESSIYHLTHDRKIPCFKQGKRLYFRRSELENWLTENPQRVRIIDRSDIPYYPGITKRRRASYV